MSKFAIVQRNDKGVYAKVTQDITLKQGQMVFFNDYEESVKFLGENGIITKEEANKKIKRTRELDREYNRETLYSLRAGKLEAKDGSGAASGKGKTL